MGYGKSLCATAVQSNTVTPPSSVAISARPRSFKILDVSRLHGWSAVRAPRPTPHRRFCRSLSLSLRSTPTLHDCRMRHLRDRNDAPWMDKRAIKPLRTREWSCDRPRRLGHLPHRLQYQCGDEHGSGVSRGHLTAESAGRWKRLGRQNVRIGECRWFFCVSDLSDKPINAKPTVVLPLAEAILIFHLIFPFLAGLNCKYYLSLLALSFSSHTSSRQQLSANVFSFVMSGYCAMSPADRCSRPQSQNGLVSNVKAIWDNIFILPPGIRTICAVQFFAS